MSAGELPGPGDFARIVDGCECGWNERLIGQVVLVTGVSGPESIAECAHCARRHHGRYVDSPQWGSDDCYPQAWLRKVPPDRQLVEEIEREAIPA
jgi:hypothetical protein